MFWTKNSKKYLTDDTIYQGILIEDSIIIIKVSPLDEMCRVCPLWNTHKIAVCGGLENAKKIAEDMVNTDQIH